MPRYPEISAFILGGGASSRMGAEKGTLLFGNEPLVQSIAQLLKPLVHEVAVVGKPETYSGLDLHVIPDRVIGVGRETVRTPLLGIATALSFTASPWNLILACDLPYLTRPWLDWLLARAPASKSQIVMPRTSAGLEPLAAVYRRECASPILEALEEGTRKVTDALSTLSIEFAEETEWSELDPDHCVLRNMNSPEDYRDAKKWWEHDNRGT